MRLIAACSGRLVCLSTLRALRLLCGRSTCALCSWHRIVTCGVMGQTLAVQ